jgi:glycosyltransferase involved in cell wall biosynthesis
MTEPAFVRDGTERLGALHLAPNVRVAISVVMPTLNEGHGLKETLADLYWADDVIVVDGGSSDDTAAIARRAGARVLVVPGVTIAQQRNAGIAIARHHWVLALDADERVSDELRESLSRLSRSPAAAHSAFRVRSRNWHLGRELRHGPWGRDWKVRVFSRDRRYAVQWVHEHLEGLTDVGALDGTLLHRPYRDLSHQVLKIATYAAWAARDLRARGRRGRVWDLFTRPAWRFLRDYVFLSGWRDGAPGFVVAWVSAFSVFLKYACLLVDTSPPGSPTSAS